MTLLKVYVSRDTPWPYFNEVERKGKAAFIYKACVRFEPMHPGPLPDCHWIFFSSPTGIRLFLAEYALPENVKVAVLGPGTAAALEGVHVNLKFSPAHYDVGRAITEFAASIAPHEKVLYPRSMVSLKRLSKALPPEQLIDWPFYNTLPNAPKHPVYDDYVVLTSPSNAEAYLSAHRVRNGQRLVAIGTSTARKISSLGHRGFLVSEAPHPEALWKIIAEDAGLAKP